MFKRRTPRSSLRVVREFVYPRGGWARAAAYVKHRLRRLPDPPWRIGRGVAAGVFISFTPLFGLHFIASALLALAIRGNVIAAVLGTFAGNPLTFPFIAVLSMQIGDHILGTSRAGRSGVWESVSAAWADVWWNLRAAVTPDPMHWAGLGTFFEDVFLPYTVGGALPGLLAASAAYAITVPTVKAYQRRRAGLAARRLERLAAAAKGRAGGVPRRERRA